MKSPGAQLVGSCRGSSVVELSPCKRLVRGSIPRRGSDEQEGRRMIDVDRLIHLFAVREALASCALDRGDHDGRTVVLVPQSTAWEHPSGKIRWWHPEGCAVRTGVCTCND